MGSSTFYSFLYSIVYSVYSIFTYTDPFPNVPSSRYLIRGEFISTVFSLLIVFVNVYFIKSIIGLYNNANSFDSYTNFRLFLKIYSIYLLLMSLKALIVISLWKDIYVKDGFSFNANFYINVLMVFLFFMFLNKSKKNLTKVTRTTATIVNGKSKTNTFTYYE